VLGYQIRRAESKRGAGGSRDGDVKRQGSDNMMMEEDNLDLERSGAEEWRQIRFSLGPGSGDPE
jgi:hypothetical protein